MPYQVKKILNRAYLEDKPYNDIVLHLEKEMRLNGLGAPDENTLVPLNKIEPTQTQTETKPTQNTTQNTKKGYRFYCNKFGHFKAECRKRRRDEWQQTRKHNGQTTNSTGTTLKCDTCGNPTKQKTAGIELTRQTTRDLNDISNKRGKQMVLPNNRRTKSAMNQKTSKKRETVDARAYSPQDPPPHYTYKWLNNRVRPYPNRRLV